MIEDLLHKYSKLKKSNNELEHREFFNDLYSLDENKILEFIIRSECYRGNKGKYFWNSNIPLKVLSLLIKSNEAKIILKRYFEKEENVNEEFIKELSFNFPNEFYEVYRESKVYLKEKHFDSSSFLKFQS
ncbi:MAG: hypothetical protein KDK36_05820, partial [Leptospiraceae bacterium]|nr:hypothetical protein [Leptospiraceae bacterium]